MTTHSSVLAWRIPGTAEPGGLLSMGSHRVRHNWSDLAAAAAKYFLIIYSMFKSRSYEHHCFYEFKCIFIKYLICHTHPHPYPHPHPHPHTHPLTQALLSIGFPRQEYWNGVSFHFLLQGILLTQESNLCLLHWQTNSLPLSYLRSLDIHIPV